MAIVEYVVGMTPKGTIAEWSFTASAVSKQRRSGESGVRVGHKQYRLVEKGTRDKVPVKKL